MSTTNTTPYSIFALKFNTYNYGKGIALVIAYDAGTALKILKQQGQLNSVPVEYQLLQSLEIGESTVTTQSLLYEIFANEDTSL